MKNTFLIILLFISTIAISQNSITKNVGDFSELKVFDLIEVNLIPSTENKVVIKGENTQDVKIINEAGKLKIRMYLDNRFNGEETFVEVHYTHLKIIDGNEGAQITGNQMIEQNTIELKTQEGARIHVGLDVNFVKVKAVSGGIIEVSGSAQTQEVTVNSGGIYDAEELLSQDATLRITAGGEVSVHSKNSVDIRGTAGGDVTVYGNPKNVYKKTFAGGRIDFVD